MNFQEGRKITSKTEKRRRTYRETDNLICMHIRYNSNHC